MIKGTFLQIGKAPINDHLCVSEVSWFIYPEFYIPTIYDFGAIYPWKSLFLTACNLKTSIAMNAKISVFVICVEAILYFLLHNLHDCTFNS